MIMASQTQGTVVKDSVQTFNLRALYQLGGNQFVVPEPPVKGEMKLVSGDKDEHPGDMLEVEVVTKNTKQNIPHSTVNPIYVPLVMMSVILHLVKPRMEPISPTV